MTGEISLWPVAGEARGPGFQVAAPSPTAGDRGRAYAIGTSVATALASRLASDTMDFLGELSAEDGDFSFPDAQYHPVLTKALLVHAASWGEVAERLRSDLSIPSANLKKELTRILGYGPVDISRIASATRTRTLLVGAGSIVDKIRDEVRLPLPIALAARTDWRRLIVTLAWFSPINPRSRLHRMARLRFEPHKAKLGVDQRQVEEYAGRRGTVQHEVIEGGRAVAFVDGEALSIDIDCRIDAGKLVGPIRYGIVATLEVADSVQADIHAQIRQGLRLQQRLRVVPQVR